MAGVHRIDTPRGSIIQTGNASCRLVWSTDFGQARTAMFNRKQMVVDSEVLRYCSPLVPLRTSMLEKSGTLGTVIGSGEVRYIAAHASFQYYKTATSRSYAPKRGGLWFERMKTAHKKDIQRAAERG